MDQPADDLPTPYPRRRQAGDLHSDVVTAIWRLRRKPEARRQLIVSIRQPTPALRANFSSQVTSVALSFSASAA